ncbi:nephrocystin-1 isoform X2 [Phycodurus eques]|uniref:nephrocystin-1 isoform X2 n=1 Tax=Phycodurus eques TaxID=693459 RepID=UPI002ACD49C3|nr:nephrocystin-1 isoform X2 [Phycodurus eques]
MPPKGKGPLQQVHKEVDDMRGQLESLLKDVQGKVETKEESFRRCQELQISAEKTLKNLTQLTKADEIAPVGNYDQRKLEEERRLHNVLEQLNKLSGELSPPGPSTEPPTGDAQKEDGEDDGTEDGDEADSDEDTAADKDDSRKDESQAPNATPHSGPCIYTALSDFKGDQDGDLTVKRGDTLKIIRKTSDGWWLAENANGDRGVVPRTYLKIGSVLGDDKDEEEDEESDEAEEEQEGSEELGEEEEEDDEEEEEKRSDAPQSNWPTFRKALTEIDATDVLAAMGTIPSGFRPSTLSKLLVDEGAKYRGSHFMQPELSQSQLSFSDLFLDPDTGRVRPRHTRTCVCFTLWSCKSIPTPGVGVQVLSRHIRLCAFDGTRVLSNIHTVRATYTPKKPRTWLFSPRTAGLLPSLLDGDCFLRCDADNPDLGILFELGVTFIRNSTGERGDLSCGWTFLKLSDAAGNPLPHRTYEIPVSGGTPYEKDVDMEGSLTRAHAESAAAAQTHRQVQDAQQSHQNATQLPAQHAAALSELGPAAGDVQAAAGRRAAGGPAHHAERGFDIQSRACYFPDPRGPTRPAGCCQDCLDGCGKQHEPGTEERRGSGEAGVREGVPVVCVVPAALVFSAVPPLGRPRLGGAALAPHRLHAGGAQAGPRPIGELGVTGRPRPRSSGL